MLRPKHVEDSNKHVIKEIVRQVGHLPELYEDARSEKYKILFQYVVKLRGKFFDDFPVC